MRYGWHFHCNRISPKVCRALGRIYGAATWEHQSARIPRYREDSMNTKGFALEAALFMLLIIAVLVAVSVSGVVTETRTSGMDYRNARVTYAAEAGADAIMAQLEVALQDGALSNAELAAVAPPSIPGFIYDAVSVSRQGGVVVQTITDGPFAGLYSLSQDLEITSGVRDQSQNRAKVVVSAKAQAIPIFQFGIFFEQDLEVTNGPNMTFDGWVHSNGNIYLSSNNAWYRDIITTPNQAIHNRKDKDQPRNGVWIADAFGVDNNLNFDSRTHPVPANFQFQSNVLFDDRLQTGAYGVDSLNVPLPTGMPARAVMEPRVPGDVQAVRNAKFSWRADWYVEIDMSDANPCTGPGTVVVRASGQTLPNAAECNAIFSMGTEAFYEGRQGHLADVLTIDMAQLFAWAAGDPAKETQIFYVTFTNVGLAPDPSGDGVFPAVRVRNGASLGNPITIATDYPFYIEGDYNSVGWQPAAVVGDAINFLSNAWTDAAHTGPGMTTAAHTTI